MARRHAAPADRRKTARPRPPRPAWRRPRAPAPYPPRAPAARSQSRLRMPASSRPIAAGTISAMIRAPWLPPNTSSCNGPSAAGIRDRRRGDHGRPHRIAGERRLGGECRRGAEYIGEGRCDCGDARRQKAVGAADDGVGVVDQGRDAAPRRRQHRRHGRIAAEADDGRGPQPAEKPPRLEQGRGRVSTAVPASENGSRPRMVALGITCTMSSAKAPP